MYLMYRTAIQHDTAQKAIHHVDDLSEPSTRPQAGQSRTRRTVERKDRLRLEGKAVPIAAVHSSRPAAPPAATFAGVLAGADTHGTPSQAAAPACAAELSSRRAREHVSRACCAMAVWPRCQEAWMPPRERRRPSAKATRSRGSVSPLLKAAKNGNARRTEGGAHLRELPLTPLSLLFRYFST